MVDTAMAEEEDKVEETKEYDGPFKEMHFDEPNEEDLYGIPSETEDTEDAEGAEDEEEAPQFYDPDDPDRVGEEDAAIPDEVVDVPEGLQSDLVDLAKKQGLSEEEINRIGNPDALDVIVSALQKRAVDAIAEDAEEQKSDAAVQEIEQSREQLTAIEEMNPEDHFDPVAAKAIKALKGELDRMRGELANIGGVAIAAQSEQDLSVIAKQYPEILGDGPTKNLVPHSDFVRNRTRLLDEVSVLRAGYRAANKAIPEDKDLFAKAFQSVFGSKINEIERQRFSKKVKAREKQFISRATNNRNLPKKGRDRAVANVAAMMRDKGMLEIEPDTFE
jgi:uncharacterized protein with von Willebrand factor type A (vWA) domain